MRVKDLIQHLQTLDPELLVVRELYSENVLLEEADLDVSLLCEPRPDGWVPNRRPDKPTQEYLVIEGN